MNEELKQAFARILRDAASAYSEEEWCAGWITGLGEHLWDERNEDEFCKSFRAVCRHLGFTVKYDVETDCYKAIAIPT